MLIQLRNYITHSTWWTVPRYVVAYYIAIIRYDVNSLWYWKKMLINWYCGIVIGQFGSPWIYQKWTCLVSLQDNNWQHMWFSQTVMTSVFVHKQHQESRIQLYVYAVHMCISVHAFVTICVFICISMDMCLYSQLAILAMHSEICAV